MTNVFLRILFSICKISSYFKNTKVFGHILQHFPKVIGCDRRIVQIFCFFFDQKYSFYCTSVSDLTRDEGGSASGPHKNWASKATEKLFFVAKKKLPRHTKTEHSTKCYTIARNISNFAYPIISYYTMLSLLLLKTSLCLLQLKNNFGMNIEFN